VAPYFGHPEVDLAFVDVFSPVAPELFGAYVQFGQVDPGFADRRELWRLPGYLGVIAVDGGADFGRAFLSRLAAAVAHYT
jgi:fructosamine-3-kinase